MRSGALTSWAALLSLAGAVAADDNSEALREIISAAFPSLEITRIREAQIPGLYEVLSGAEVVYVSADGRYLLQGELIDLQTLTNLSEAQRAAVRAQRLKAVPEADTVNFAPPAGAKHTVYVFTDFTCGYCRLFHRDMAELNDRGVAVRYLAYPRAGADSAPFRDMESIWCAADRNAAMTAAKQGEKVAARSCDNPVARQYELGRELGVEGTPAIYLDNGKAIRGYLPPDELLQFLDS